MIVAQNIWQLHDQWTLHRSDANRDDRAETILGRSREQPMNNGSQQDVPPYVAQGAPKVNFNVQI